MDLARKVAHILDEPRDKINGDSQKKGTRPMYRPRRQSIGRYYPACSLSTVVANSSVPITPMAPAT